MAKHDRWYSRPIQRFWAYNVSIESCRISTKLEIAGVKGWGSDSVGEIPKRLNDWPMKSELHGKEGVAHYFLPSGTDPAPQQSRLCAKSLAVGVVQ